ncbi:elongation factor G [Candidatus Poribacteria bacterium]|nr:elongation factor G [Candidatus Poribacteria bacterium]
MKEYRPNQIRNIGIFSHARAGKTSLTEALLYDSGAISKLGRSDDGNTVSDYDEDEIRRNTSINTALCICEWKDCKINLIDTPGYSDFAGEQEAAARVSDNILIVTDASMGLEAGAEKAWERAEKYDIPRAIFLNKIDKEMAKFDETLQALEVLGGRIVPVSIPIGVGLNFKGIIDLVKMKAYVKGDNDKKLQEIDIPEDMQDQIDEHRETLIDAVAEADDELLEKYLGGEELTDEEIKIGLKKGISDNMFVPLTCGSAYENIGPQMLLDLLVSFASPVDAKPVKATKPGSEEEEVEIEIKEDGPLCAFVFKTMSDPYAGKVSYFKVYSGIFKSDSRVINVNKNTEERIGTLSLVSGKKFTNVDKIVAGDFGMVTKLSETDTNDTLCDEENELLLPPIDFPKPVISMAITPKTQGDDEKLSTMLTRMTEEDPTFILRRDNETKETIISGMGELHINVILDRIKNRYNVEAETRVPKVPYRETIRGKSEQQGRYKKQTGGRGQYGDAWIRMEPNERGAGFEFIDAIVGGAIPRQYIPAVEKGLIESMEEGILAGSQVVDMKITLYDGGFHPVDSSEMAFKIAASMAFKKAMEAAQPFIMEPIMEVEITVPDEYMGDVMSDLNSRRGRILGMNPSDGKQIIKANVPMAEMFRYSVDLRSITSDRGSFTMEFSHYEEVPFDISEKIVAEYQASQESS